MASRGDHLADMWADRWADIFRRIDVEPSPAPPAAVRDAADPGEPAAVPGPAPATPRISVGESALLWHARAELFTATDWLHIARRTLAQSSRDGWAAWAGRLAEDCGRLRRQLEEGMT